MVWKLLVACLIAEFECAESPCILSVDYFVINLLKPVVGSVEFWFWALTPIIPLNFSC